MIAWRQIQHDFEWDGSLRDIYVRGTTIEDWRVVCDILKKLPGVEFRLDGEAAPFPEDIAHIFAKRAEKNAMLSVKLGYVTAAFHFFTDQEIECDIDPREVTSQLELDAVLAFLKKVGDAIAKPVVLTHENTPESEIVRYDPSLQMFKYVKAT